MSSDSELQARGQAYADRHGVLVNFDRRLGFGQDGQVWKSMNNTAATAIKVFERQGNYITERVCYERLQARDIDEICGLQVPMLVRSDDELMVVEMSIVEPPYVLDFGKAHVDQPFDFNQEGRAEWREQMLDWWGESLPLVDRVLARLKGLGIYYYDAKPGNIVLTGKK